MGEGHNLIAQCFMQDNKYYGNLIVCRDLIMAVSDAITGIVSLMDGPPERYVDYAFNHLMNVRDVLDLIVRLTLEMEPGND